MKDRNLIGILIAFAIIAIIRVIGIQNIPSPVITILLIVCAIGMLLIAIKYKGDKKEKLYLLIMTIIMILLFSVLIIWGIVDDNYPNLSQQFKPIFISLMAILFVILLIVIFANAVYKFGNNKSKKK